MIPSISLRTCGRLFSRKAAKRTFGTPDDLVNFLTALAQTKSLTRRKRLKASKYNVNREEWIDDSKQFDKEQLNGGTTDAEQIVMSRRSGWSSSVWQPLVYRRIYILFEKGKRKRKSPAN